MENIMVTATESKPERKKATVPPLLAFHGDPAIKAHYLARIAAHEAADEIIKGFYWEDGKGCAVGCTIHSSSHDRYETELGIPQALALLQDGLFEVLPNGDAKTFPRLFLGAIPVGADLALVVPRFLHWLLVDPKDGAINYVEDGRPYTGQVRKAINDVGALWLDVIEGRRSAARSARSVAWSAAESAARSARNAARSAAESAARNAAWSAAESAARSAARSARNAARSVAWSAAESAESAARSAAWSVAESAAWSAAWSAAESAARLKQRDYLLALLSAAPVPAMQ
jgi:hypothetical protein